MKRKTVLSAAERRKLAKGSHRYLTGLGIPRSADGGRLGLRKRTETAEKLGLLKSSRAKE